LAEARRRPRTEKGAQTEVRRLLRRQAAQREKVAEEERLKLLHQLQDAEEAQVESWRRAEEERLVRQAELTRLAEARRRPRTEKGAQTEVVTCPRFHELRLPRHPRRTWICDGRRLPGGCKSGISDFGPHRIARFRCEECDYDLCKECHFEAMAQAHAPEPDAEADLATTPGSDAFFSASGAASAASPATPLSAATRRWGASAPPPQLPAPPAAAYPTTPWTQDGGAAAPSVADRPAPEPLYLL